MVALFQVVGSGWSGGPGVNTWAFSDVQPFTVAATSLAEFYDGFKDDYAPGIRWDFDGTVKTLNTETGAILSNSQVPPWSQVATSATGGNESRASQIKIQLLTNTVANRRIVRGGVFVGPLGNNAIGPDGQLNTERHLVWQGAIDRLVGATEVSVWHRPVNKLGGLLAPVTTGSFMVAPAVLRGRRD